MNPKPVVPRTLAVQDVEDAIGYYLKRPGRRVQAALAFVDALEDAYAILGRHPGIGSARYATELQVPGLRSWSLPRFPYVIFYGRRMPDQARSTSRVSRMATATSPPWQKTQTRNKRGRAGLGYQPRP